MTDAGPRNLPPPAPPPRRRAARHAWRRLAAGALALLAAAAPRGAGAQRAAPAEGPITVALVTAGPGDHPLTWIGHSALLVRGPAGGAGIVVDYGAIERSGDAIRRALAGRPRALVRARDASRALAELARGGRTVSVLPLRLDDAQARALLRLVDADLATARGRYPYQVDRDNCATRLRDHLDAALGGALRASGRARSPWTPRALALARLAPERPLAALAVDVLANGDADRAATAWELAAQPAGLEALVRAAAVDAAGRAVPLAERRGDDVPDGAPPTRGALAIVGALAGMLAAALAATRARPARVALGVQAAVAAALLGGPGAVVAAAWALGYPYARGNETLLLANPLALLLVPPALAFAAGSPRAARTLRAGWGALAALAVAALGLELVPGLRQDDGRVLALVVPLTTGLAAAFALAARVAVRRAPLAARSLSSLTVLEARP